MHVHIWTDTPEHVDPRDVAKVLDQAGYYVNEVRVNGGEPHRPHEPKRRKK